MSDHHHFSLRLITTRTLNDRMQNYPILLADPSKLHGKELFVDRRHLSSGEVVRVEFRTRVCADRLQVKIVTPAEIRLFYPYNCLVSVVVPSLVER